MALEEARRQAFVDRAVAQSRLQSDRGLAVDADVAEADLAEKSGDVEYLELAPLDLARLGAQLQAHQGHGDAAVHGVGAPVLDTSASSGGAGGRETREQRREEELRRREAALAEARRQHFEDMQRLRRKVAGAQSRK